MFCLVHEFVNEFRQFFKDFLHFISINVLDGLRNLLVAIDDDRIGVDPAVVLVKFAVFADKEFVYDKRMNDYDCIQDLLIS